MLWQQSPISKFNIVRAMKSSTMGEINDVSHNI